MAGVELANAWITIVPDTSKIAPTVNKAFGKVGGNVDKVGQSLGSRLSNGISKTLKVGAATVGAAVGGVLTASITKGMGRLIGIENAEAALRGLGHEAESVESIMDNALASVKGTSFGLEEAAGSAASAVAAGIDPGADLERTLTLMGDAATIAGTDMQTMGSIVNKVATADMMQMDVANQLMDAGIPIIQMVADEMGVTAEEARKMASAGEVSFETFQTALEEGVGGAALEAGNTFQGSLANMGAAMGRFGADLAEPAFTAAPAVFTAIGDAFDDMGERLEPLIETFGEWLTPQLENLAENIGPWTEKAFDAVADAAVRIYDAVSPLWPAVESLAGSFARVVGSISVATWQALGGVLEALTPVIETVLVPLAEHVADFAEQNPGAVTAIVGAFLGFKAVSAIAGPLGTFVGVIRNLGGAFSFLKGAFAGAGGPAAGLVNVLFGGSGSKNPIISKLAGWVGKFTGVLAKIGPVISTIIRFINPWVGAITLLVGALSWFFTQTELGKELWSGFTEFLQEKWETFTGWLSAAWDGITSIFQGDFTSAIADAFTFDEDSKIVQGFTSIRDALLGVWDGIKAGFEGFMGVVETVGQVVMNIFGGVLAVAFGLAIVAWDGLSWAFQATYQNVIKPVFDWFGDAATWLYEGVIRPVVDWIVEKWNWLGDALSSAWDTIRTTVIDVFAAAMTFLWESVISPVVDWISDKWDWLSGMLVAAWTTIKTLVIDAFAAAATWLYENVISPVLGWIVDRWNWLSAMLAAVWAAIKATVIDAFAAAMTFLWENIISPVLGWVVDRWNWLRDMMHAAYAWISTNVIDAFQNTMQRFRDFFSTVVDGIRDRWNDLKAALAGPINFLIETVYNGGIAPAWDRIADFLPLEPKEAKRLSPISGYKTGGAVFGAGTGTSDDIPAWLSNGEHVFTAAEVRAIGGHGALYALRRALLGGDGFTFDGEGFTLLPEYLRNDRGDLMGAAPSLFPAFATGGEVRPLWELQLQRGHEFAKSQHGKPYQWAGPNGPGSSFDCSGFMGSIAATIQGTNPWQRYWATMSFPSPGAQGFVPGLGPGFSIGIFNGGPYGGHTAGTLGPVGPYSSTNVESGGSPSMVKYGIGAAGADHGQFDMRYHLPIGADGSFVSGGAGGVSPESMKDIIAEKLTGVIDTIMGPIVGLLPSPPPHWKGIPKGFYDSGKEGLVESIAGGVANLGDRLSSTFTAIQGMGDLVRNGATGAWEWLQANLFDTGGVWKSGTLGLNLSGKNEYVFTNAAMKDFQQATRNINVAAAVLAQAVKSGNPELARAVVAEMSREFMGVMEKIANPRTYEGVAARAFGEQVAPLLSDIGLTSVSDLLSGVLGAEEGYLSAQADHAARMDSLREKTQALATANEALEAARQAEYEDEQSRADAIGKATDDLAKAESDLADARLDSARNLDMSLHSVLPQVSGALSGLAATVGGFASQAGAAAPAVTSVASGLAGMAAMAGPAGVSIGVLIAGIASIIQVVQLVEGVIKDIVGRLTSFRTAQQQIFSDYLGNVAEVNSLLTQQKQHVVDLAASWVDAVSRMAEAARAVTSAQGGVYSAALEGAKGIAAIQQQIRDARNAVTGGGGGGSSWVDVPMDMGLLYDSYANELTATPRVKQQDQGGASLRDVVNSANEIAALQQDLFAAEINAQILMKQAYIDLLNAQYEQWQAQMTLVRLEQDLIGQMAHLNRLQEIQVQFAMTEQQAILGQQYAQLAMKVAEADATLMDVGNQIGRALDFDGDGKIFGILTNVGSSSVQAAEMQKQSALDQMKVIEGMAAQYGGLPSMGDLAPTIDLVARLTAAGEDTAAQMALWGSELGDPQRQLDLVNLENTLFEVDQNQLNLARSVEDMTASWEHLMKVMPLQEEVFQLEHARDAHTAQAEYLRASSEDVKLAAAALRDFHAAEAAREPTRIDVSIPSRGQMIDPQDVWDTFNEVNRALDGHGLRIVTLERANRTGSNDVLTTRRY